MMLRNNNYNYEDYEQKWLAVRQAEYFKEHQSSVKKYGVVTQAMKMSPRELDNLRQDITLWEYAHFIKINAEKDLYQK